MLLFWITCLVIVAYAIQSTLSILAKTYGENREEYAYKVFFEAYPELYSQFGGFPTKYLNTCYPSPGKVMDLTIKDFHIASAYKPYQIAGQTYDICSYKGIEAVLDKGARFHFIEVWSSNVDNIYDDGAVPLVRGETLMPKYGRPLLFEKVCELYAKKAWIGNKYPLILYFKLHSSASQNRFVLGKMADTLLRYFKNRFLDKEFAFSREKVGDIPIKKAVGKVIFLANMECEEGRLKELMNGVIAKDVQNSGQIMVYDKGNQSHGGVKAKTSNMQSVIDYNKTHLGILVPNNDKNITNIYQPGVDILQISAREPMEEYGFQIVCLNYQKPGRDREDYFRFFKKSSFVMKKDKVRYIPCPAPTVKRQNKKASYKPRNINYQDGYFSHFF